MKIEIIKTTSWINNIKPCKSATVLKDEDGDDRFFVEIKSLQDLLEILKDVDERIILHPDKGKLDYIEIYDDYRE
jgi:hypothetical protein